MSAIDCASDEDIETEGETMQKTEAITYDTIVCNPPFAPKEGTTLDLLSFEVYPVRQVGHDGKATWRVTYADGATTDLVQPFVCGSARYVEGQPVWGWDGDEKAPTLHPSFDAWTGSTKVHLWLRAGRVTLLPDSTPMKVRTKCAACGKRFEASGRTVCAACFVAGKP